MNWANLNIFIRYIALEGLTPPYPCSNKTSPLATYWIYTIHYYAKAQYYYYYVQLSIEYFSWVFDFSSYIHFFLRARWPSPGHRQQRSGGATFRHPWRRASLSCQANFPCRSPKCSRLRRWTMQRRVALHLAISLTKPRCLHALANTPDSHTSSAPWDSLGFLLAVRFRLLSRPSFFHLSLFSPGTHHYLYWNRAAQAWEDAHWPARKCVLQEILSVVYARFALFHVCLFDAPRAMGAPEAHDVGRAAGFLLVVHWFAVCNTLCGDGVAQCYSDFDLWITSNLRTSLATLCLHSGRNVRPSDPLQNRVGCLAIAI